MPTEKVEKFRVMVEENPDNELARYSLGTALFDIERFEEAEKEFAAVLEMKSDWVMAYILRGRCLIQLQKYGEARKLLETGRGYSVEQGHEGPVEEIDDILEELPS